MNRHLSPENVMEEAEQHVDDININSQLNGVIRGILTEDVNDPDFDEDRVLVDFDDKLLYQIYAENINLFSDYFNEKFIDEILASNEEVNNVDELSQLLIRDVNELWKFMYFMFTCLRAVEIDKDCFLSKFPK